MENHNDILVMELNAPLFLEPDIPDLATGSHIN